MACGAHWTNAYARRRPHLHEVCRQQVGVALREDFKEQLLREGAQIGVRVAQRRQELEEQWAWGQRSDARQCEPRNDNTDARMGRRSRDDESLQRRSRPPTEQFACSPPRRDRRSARAAPLDEVLKQQLRQQQQRVAPHHRVVVAQAVGEVWDVAVDQRCVLAAEVAENDHDVVPQRRLVRRLQRNGTAA